MLLLPISVLCFSNDIATHHCIFFSMLLFQTIIELYFFSAIATHYCLVISNVLVPAINSFNLVNNCILLIFIPIKYVVLLYYSVIVLCYYYYQCSVKVLLLKIVV